MPIFRPRKFTFFPFLILFKRIESIDMTPCVISFLVILVGNEDMHKISDKGELLTNPITDYGVSCHWAFEKKIPRTYNGKMLLPL